MHNGGQIRRRSSTNNTSARSWNIIRIPLLVRPEPATTPVLQAELTCILGTDTTFQQSANAISSIRSWRTKGQRTRRLRAELRKDGRGGHSIVRCGGLDRWLGVVDPVLWWGNLKLYHYHPPLVKLLAMHNSFRDYLVMNRWEVWGVANLLFVGLITDCMYHEESSSEKAASGFRRAASTKDYA